MSTADGAAPADLGTSADLGVVDRWPASHPRLTHVMITAVAAATVYLGSGGLIHLPMLRWQILLIGGGFAVLAAARIVWHKRRPQEFFLAAATYALIWTIALQPHADELTWGAWVFVWMALYQVAERVGFVTACVGLVTAQAVNTAILAWLGVGWQDGLLASLVVNITIGAATILLGQRRRTVKVLTERNRLLTRQRDERAQLAVAAERSRIAREMHDIVSHSLTVMVSLSDGAARLVAKDPAAAAEAMGQVSKTGRRAVADMRRTLAFLSSEADLAPLPGLTDLSDLIALYQHSGLPVTVELTTDLPDDKALGLNIYRIVQEGLTNVLRHAPTTPLVTVRIAQAERGLIDVVIENAPAAAPGPPVTEGAGHGLVGVGQRTAVWDGTLEAGPTADGGWRVHARLRIDLDDEPMAAPAVRAAARSVPDRRPLQP
ncbi:MAG: histidine kinase [Propionibacteriaceae bacterium]|jgi:signal transduction histidine kinase|nr:histidine kinase [Propionibacteriaceae bacterium]